MTKKMYKAKRKAAIIALMQLGVAAPILYFPYLKDPDTWEGQIEQMSSTIAAKRGPAQ